MRPTTWIIFAIGIAAIITALFYDAYYMILSGTFIDLVIQFLLILVLVILMGISWKMEKDRIKSNKITKTK